MLKESISSSLQSVMILLLTCSIVWPWLIKPINYQALQETKPKPDPKPNLNFDSLSNKKTKAKRDYVTLPGSHTEPSMGWPYFITGLSDSKAHALNSHIQLFLPTLIYNKCKEVSLNHSGGIANNMNNFWLSVWPSVCHFTPFRICFPIH